MAEHFDSLADGEVISVGADVQVLLGHHTFRVCELNDAIKKQLESTVEGWNEAKSGWLSPEGINCEALRFGSSGWQKGKIRLCLEFSPDQPEMAMKALESGGSIDPIIPVGLALETIALSDHTQAPNAVKAVAESSGNEPPGVPKNITLSTPHLTEAILVMEDDRSIQVDLPLEEMKEITFDFDRTSSNNQGTMVSDGMMELDLIDLDLDRPEYNDLNLEATGAIEEVWNEISQQQPNWPGIH